ncbi:MAG: glycine betaine ABC transporter substrate-binding protein [Rudaea sp.]
MGRTALFGLIVLLAACSPQQPTIVVGSKNFTEQVILGEIVAAQIERRLHVNVDRKLNLGGTLLAHEALIAGSIDLYPEYTGTALTEVLRRPIEKDSHAVFTHVQSGYRTWNVEWMAPLGFNDTFAMVVRADTAQQEQLRTLSDAAKRPWKLGVGYEFTQRPDGLNGLVQTYGLKIDGAPVAMDLGLLYAALKTKAVDMAAANATDGMLGHKEFVVLEDDRHYFPPYECAIAVRSETLKRFPGLREALSELSGRIDDAAMRRMNEQVDIDHKRASDVAREFLETWK